MELNLLPERDCVYGAATAPACPYWHFPQARLVQHEMAESRGLDPHTLRCLPVSNGCRTPVRLTFRMAKKMAKANWRKQIGGRLSARCSHANACRTLSRRRRHPDRLVFRVGGWLRSRSPYGFVRTAFKTVSAARPISHPDCSDPRRGGRIGWIGKGSRIRTRDLLRPRQELYRTELYPCGNNGDPWENRTPATT
jgi:hypothetical protein